MSLEKLSERAYTWFRWSAGLGYDLNGHCLVGDDEGSLLVDPPEVTFDEVDEIEAIGGPRFIVITNHTHWRDTAAHLERWDVPVLAHAVDGLRLPRVDRMLDAGEVLPGGWRVIAVPGKTAGEIALHYPAEGGVLLVGDTLIGDPPGELRLVPEAKIEDRESLMESLAKIAALEFDALLVGDGHSILHGAGPVVRAFVERLQAARGTPERTVGP